LSDHSPLEPAIIKAGIVVVLGTIMSMLDTTIVAVVLRTRIAQRFPTTGVGLPSGLIGPTMHDRQSSAGAFRHSFGWSFSSCVLAIVPALVSPNTGVAKPTSLAEILEFCADE
jgi:hypothetical protein